jgi:hypothetical protein
MVKTKQFELSQQANAVISETLKKRIPLINEFRVDNNPSCVAMADFFGNTDTLVTVGGERVYKNQSKSRCDKGEDICIICRSSRSQFVNPETKEDIPLGGAYWYETGKCWLTPRWGEIDTFTVYLPGFEFVGHFCRYYLDVMFSKQSTWETMTGIYKEKDDGDSYAVFFNYKSFCKIYMQTVLETAIGDEAILASNDTINPKEEQQCILGNTQ